MTKCDGQFDFYAHRHEATVEYLAAALEYCRSAGPALAGKKGAIEVFIQSLVPLLVAKHEWFLGMILVVGVRERADHWRNYLIDLAQKPTDKNRLQSCDLRILIQEAKKTVGMKKQGAAFTRVFTELFDFSPWPSAEARNTILDLNLLRQLFVHHDAATLGDDYWKQFSRKSLLRTRQYGNLTPIHFVDYWDCLNFLLEAVQAIEKQRLYLRSEMLKRPEWIVDDQGAPGS